LRPGLLDEIGSQTLESLIQFYVQLYIMAARTGGRTSLSVRVPRADHGRPHATRLEILL
jgi:hypothetical protein